MKPCRIYLALAAMLFIAACDSNHHKMTARQAISPPATSASVNQMSSQNNVIIRDVKYALSLEENLELPCSNCTEDEVFKYFRQGYTSKMARQLAKYYYPEIPDGAEKLPTTINIISVASEKATVSYERTPDNVRKGGKKIITLIVRKEGERWKIDQSI